MNIIKKIVAVAIFLVSIGLSSQGVEATSCQGSQAVCSQLSASTCGTGTSYYEVQSSTPNTKTTYCTQCSVCIAGDSDCVKGALGCNSCQIATGGDNGTGLQCVAAQGQCAAGGGSCSWSN